MLAGDGDSGDEVERGCLKSGNEICAKWNKEVEEAEQNLIKRVADECVEAARTKGRKDAGHSTLQLW